MSKGFSHESQNANTVEWYTPPSLFEAMGVQFDLDPCHPVEPLDWVPAKRTFNIYDDGLLQRWQGNVFCNPPYGRETQAWLEKMAAHGEGIALVFARTDCKWFHKAMETCTGILFLKGRVAFVPSDDRPTGGSGAGSVLIAWGLDNASVLHRMAPEHGWYADNPERTKYRGEQQLEMDL